MSAQKETKTARGWVLEWAKRIGLLPENIDEPLFSTNNMLNVSLHRVKSLPSGFNQTIKKPIPYPAIINHDTKANTQTTIRMKICKAIIDLLFVKHNAYEKTRTHNNEHPKGNKDEEDKEDDAIDKVEEEHQMPRRRVHCVNYRMR